jgi:hypothetical protein
MAPKGQTLRKALLPLVALLTAGCGLPAVSTGAGQDVSGTLSLTGPTFGEVSLSPASCISGEHHVFLGADFLDPETKLVARLAIDPLEGPGVRIFGAQEPFGAALILRRSDCEVFHFSHERNGWQLNDIYLARVSLQLRCQLPSGGSVQGELAAAACS